MVWTTAVGQIEDQKKREADKKGIKGYKNAKKTFGNGFVPRNYEDIRVVAL